MMLAADVDLPIEVPLDQFADFRVAYSLELTKLDGTAVTSLGVGQEFVLHAYTQDLRAVPIGVYAAYFDLSWDETLATVADGVQHSQAYSNVTHDDASMPGLIDEVGGVGGSSRTDGKMYEVFSVRMYAVGSGDLVFRTEPADNLPANRTLVHDEIGSNPIVDSNEIHYGDARISIEPSPSPDDSSGDPITPPTEDEETDEACPAIGDLTRGSAISTKVAYGLLVTDVDCTPITSLAPGQEFVLRAYTQDVRMLPQGVYAAFFDVRWDGNLAVVLDRLQPTRTFGGTQSGDTTMAGLIDEVGGVGGTSVLGGKVYEVFSVQMRALRSGELNFTTDPADLIPENRTLIYGENHEVDPSDIYYGGTRISIGSPQLSDELDQNPIPMSPLATEWSSLSNLVDGSDLLVFDGDMIQPFSVASVSRGDFVILLSSKSSSGTIGQGSGSIADSAATNLRTLAPAQNQAAKNTADVDDLGFEIYVMGYATDLLPSPLM